MRGNRLTELEEKTDDAASDETNLSTRIEHRATSNLFEVLVQTLDQRALREDEV